MLVAGQTGLFLLSLFCLFAIPGPFTQLVFIVPFLLAASAVMAATGRIYSALINILILCTALFLAPVNGMELIQTSPEVFALMMFFVCAAFLGVGYGVYRLGDAVDSHEEHSDGT